MNRAQFDIDLNNDHDMWCVFSSKHKWGWDPWWEKLNLFLTYFCTLLTLLYCIWIVTKVMILMVDMVRNHPTPAAITSQLKRKHQIAEACATFHPNVRVRQMMLDVGEGVPRAGVWQDLRSDTDPSKGSKSKRGVSSKNCVSFHPGSIHMFIDSHVFPSFFPFVWRHTYTWSCCSD